MCIRDRIRGCPQVMEACYDLGAYAVFISGAGPTIMAVCDAGDDSFVPRAILALEEDAATRRFAVCRYQAQNEMCIRDSPQCFSVKFT